ncbi:MAG: hypothetical protein KF852_01190 [Saprospiraceae bacterium]|nr:hypothetical protein [Saprospiraceae bacterium]
MKSLSVILSFCCLLAVAASGQTADNKVIEGDTSQIHELRSLRGDVLYGMLLRQTDDSLFFQIRPDLILRYPLAAVQSVRLAPEKTRPAPADPEPPRLAAKPDPGSENLLFSPTAFGLPAGKGEFRTFNVLWNQVEVGLSDHFSFSGGLVLPALLSLGIKATTPVSPTTHIGSGVNIFLILPEISASAYHVYGVFTKGTRDNYLNLTFGAAASFEGSLAPVFSGGGAWRFSSNWRAMADVTLLAHPDGSIVVPSCSASWFDAKNRVDFGFLAFSPFPIPIPCARYARRF